MNGLLQSLVTVGGTIVSMSISALAVIVLSRHLGPEAFGQFNVGFSLLLIVAQAADLGINYALNKLAGGSLDQKQINRLLLESTKLKLWSTAITVGLGVLLTPILANWLDFAPTGILLAAFVLAAATIWFDHLLYVLRSLHLFYSAVAITISQALLKLVGIAVLIVLGFNSATGAFVWYALAPALPLIFTPLLLPSWISYSWGSYAKQRGQLVEVIKHTGIFLLAQTVVDNMDVLFVQRSLPEAEVGLYSGISRLALLLTFAAYAFGMVLNPRVARYTDKHHLRAYFGKALLASGMAVVGFITFLPFEQLAISLTIGPEYLAGAPLLRIMIASAFLVFATVPFTALFYSQQQSWYFSLLGVVQVVTMVVGNLVFTPMYGLDGATWVKFGVRLIVLLLTLCLAAWLLWRHPEKLAVNKNRVV